MWRRDRQRRDARQFRRLGVGGEARLRVIGAGLRCRQGLVGGAAGLLEGLVDGGGIGMSTTGMAATLGFLLSLDVVSGGAARLGPGEGLVNYPIRPPVWPAGGGQGRDAALPPPYSPC